MTPKGILSDWQHMTKAQRLFVLRVERGGGGKHAASPCVVGLGVWNVEHQYEYTEALWKFPETLGFIEVVGSYKWVVTEKFKRLKAHLFEVEESEVPPRKKFTVTYSDTDTAARTVVAVADTEMQALKMVLEYCILTKGQSDDDSIMECLPSTYQEAKRYLSEAFISVEVLPGDTDGLSGNHLFI